VSKYDSSKVTYVYKSRDDILYRSANGEDQVSAETIDNAMALLALSATILAVMAGFILNL